MECVHPGNKAPVKGATNETIHASVFARYQGSIKERTAEERAEVIRLEKLEELNEHKAKRGQDKAVAVSILTWDPEALSGFRHDKPTTESGRYRREYVKEVGAWKWTGRCLKTRKLFDMWEEPDAYDKKVTAELVARLKGDLIKPSIFTERMPESEEATAKRMKDHEYLQEGFVFKGV